MKVLMFALAAVAAGASGAGQVFRLEVDDDAQRSWIHGADGVRREVVLVAPDHYAMLTGNVATAWRRLNDTREKRVALHGAVSNQVVDAKAKVKTDVHRDGFRYSEAMSPRHNAFRAKLLERKNAAPRTVTVNRDANTGKDITQ